MLTNEPNVDQSMPRNQNQTANAVIYTVQRLRFKISSDTSELTKMF